MADVRGERHAAGQLLLGRLAQYKPGGEARTPGTRRFRSVSCISVGDEMLYLSWEPLALSNLCFAGYRLKCLIAVDLMIVVQDS